MNFEQVKAGQWVQPIRKGYKMACCDCGLVHVLDFRLYGGSRKHIQFRAFRDERGTAQARRHLDSTN